jgi:ABC-type transport system involved in cytochrome bd biosynthesis fused ATPase/permease subunit
LRAIDPDAWRSRVAFLPQRPYLAPRAEVRHAIHFLAPDATDDSIRRALDRVGLTTALETRIETLSTGQRQRVALARLLCRNAELYVLDEPDANLDRAGITLAAGIVRELAKTKMVVLAAHTQELLEAADRVVVLEGGRVVRDEARVARALALP